MERTNPESTPLLPGGFRAQHAETIKATHKEKLRVCK